MSVRSGLLATFLVFVLALIGLGAWSAWHLRELAGVSRRIIADNYDSVVAAQDMKESLERQDSAALFILLGDVERGQSQLREHRVRFDRAFSRAAGNITEPDEPAVIADVDALRKTYYAVREHAPDAVVLMVTALASIELAVEAMKLGATDLMRKPMTPDTLRAAVDGAFTEAVAARAADEAGHPLDDDQAFWIRQAALALGQYMWTHAESPSGGRLLVSRAPGALISAARQRS